MKTFKAFSLSEHMTRIQETMRLVILRVTKSGFRSMGAKIHNDLPIQSRRTGSLLIFKELSRKHFNISLTIFVSLLSKFVIISILTGCILLTMYVTLKCTSCIKILILLL